MGEDEVGAPETQEGETEEGGGGLGDPEGYFGACGARCPNSGCQSSCVLGAKHGDDGLPHRCYSGHEYKYAGW